MKKLIIIPVFLMTCAVFGNGMFQLGNEEYEAGNYQEAVNSYQAVLAEGDLSPEVYYNLGNCFYRMDDITNAIYHYERALKLDPGNEKAEHNLSLCYSQTVDKVEPLPEFALTTWYKKMALSQQTDTWALFFVIALFISLVSVAGFYYVRSVGMKRTLFFGGGIMFILSGILLLLAFSNRSILHDSKHGIVFEPSVTIYSAPTENSEKLFILHEGTKVEVKAEKNDWREIMIANGNTGWVNQTAFKEI